MRSYRYNSLAIILHWLMAIGFLLMFCSGIVMEYFNIAKDIKFSLYQWHKTGGVLLLVTLMLRVALRAIKRPPALPMTFKKAEVFLAKMGHWGLYILMFAMPFSGWLMVSSSVYGLPTVIFNLFEWPHIPGVQGDEKVNFWAKEAHFVLAIIFFAFIVAHIGAVIKHSIYDKENLLRRMWWCKQIKND